MSLGGDGTFLRASRVARAADCPVLGVNFGRLGYLLEVAPEEFDDVLDEAIAGRAAIEDRLGLLVEAPGLTAFALNELAVEKTVPGHMVRVATSVNGEHLLTYAADGVVVATPTGSTAYNLSAGGPVVSPGLDVLLLTPVAPHFTIDRSIVLGPHEVVELTVLRGPARGPRRRRLAPRSPRAGHDRAWSVATRSPVRVVVGVAPRRRGSASRQPPRGPRLAMLETLRIANLGAVDELVLDLDDGLTVLTGETGVGKTLLVEALHLVLGGADRKVPVRAPDAPSRVEAIFTGPGGEVLLTRERSSHGRLRATVDGSLASAQSLAERAETLCELHGQHEHQVLRAPAAARALLDRAGGVDDAEVRALRARRRDLAVAREHLGGSAEERARRLELVAHELEEIDAVAPNGPDEVDRLLAEAASVSAILESRDALRAVAGTLDDDEETSAAGLLAAARALLPRELEGRREELAALLDAVRELAGELRKELEAVEGDPARLEALNERIARLQALIRKHGQRLGDVLDRRVALGEELARLEGDEARSAGLDEELASRRRRARSRRVGRPRGSQHGGRRRSPRPCRRDLRRWRCRTPASRSSSRAPRASRSSSSSPALAPSRPPRSPTPRAGAS